MSFAKKLEAVQELLNDIKSKVGADDDRDLFQELEDLESRLTEVEETGQSYDGRLDDLEGADVVEVEAFNELADGVEEISNDNSRLRSRVVDLEKSLEELRTTQEALTKKLAELDNAQKYTGVV